jgi:integrase
MSDTHSTPSVLSGKPARPEKPYPDFPLFAHAAGVWAKKIRGKLYYFGPWSDPDGALAKYLEQKDALHAGRTPRPATGALTVKELCNGFLNAKTARVEAGELKQRSWAEYKEVTDLLVKQFGKGRLVDDLGPEDFAALRGKMAKRWGPVRLGNAITRVKTVFRYGLDNGLIEKHVRYGGEFRKPGKAVLRRHRAQNGEKMLEANHLQAMLGGALVVGNDGPELVRPDTPLKAMILLALNAGFGNGDCAQLPRSALDLEGGWVHYARPKTGIERRCPLWPETVAALRESLAARPEPRQEGASELVFLTQRGSAWIHFTPTGGRIDNVTIQFTKLLKRLGLHRDGIGFYTLRHVFRTIADAARDPVAIDLIMGHSDPSIAGHYRERVEDSRLKTVTDHVRQWLFGSPPSGVE